MPVHHGRAIRDGCTESDFQLCGLVATFTYVKRNHAKRRVEACRNNRTRRRGSSRSNQRGARTPVVCRHPRKQTSLAAICCCANGTTCRFFRRQCRRSTPRTARFRRTTLHTQLGSINTHPTKLQQSDNHSATISVVDEPKRLPPKSPPVINFSTKFFHNSSEVLH